VAAGVVGAVRVGPLGAADAVGCAGSRGIAHRDAHLPSVGDQPVREMGTDEARAAEDRDPARLRHEDFLARWSILRDANFVCREIAPRDEAGLSLRPHPEEPAKAGVSRDGQVAARSYWRSLMQRAGCIQGSGIPARLGHGDTSMARPPDPAGPPVRPGVPIDPCTTGGAVPILTAAEL